MLKPKNAIMNIFYFSNCEDNVKFYKFQEYPTNILLLLLLYNDTILYNIV